jgi:hypothetical protein
MKPVNLNTAPCSPVSSNCVIWQGPNIPCIDLCNGDTVSDVVFALATELCTILDTLDVANYDLTCFNLTACGPSNFQDLIQFLIAQICEANGITVAPDKTTGCPDCLVSVAPCFVEGGVTTMNLTDYVNAIANKICNIIDQISVINATLNVLNIRVTALENATDPTFILPSFILGCDIDTLNEGSSYQIDEILETFINDVWCSFYSSTGTASDILAVLEPDCTLSTDITTDPNWIASPQNLADAINNIWVALCNQVSVTVDVENTSSVEMFITAGPDYIISAKVIDTGWINLNGFEYYDMTYTGSASFRPQCRRIGNVVHFRGFLVVPLAVSADLKSPLTYGYRSSPGYDSYFAVPHPFTATTGAGSCVLGVGEFLTFNEGDSVIPTGILSAGETLDKSYGIGFRIAVRPINVGIAPTSISTMLTSLASVNINSNGTLEWGPTSNSEESVVVGNTISFNTSPVNYIQSIVTLGENVPKFSATASTYDSATVGAPTPPAIGVLATTELEYLDALVYPFSANSTLAAQLGGLGVRIDGLTSFINPCTESTIVGLPC